MIRDPRGRKGVSPVIAIILMVAITVVLSGVVFLWAQTFANKAEVKNDFINLMAKAKENEAGEQTLTFLVISGSMAWEEYRISIDDIFITNDEIDITSAGDEKDFLIQEAEFDWDIGQHLDLQIIDTIHNKIIWENEIIVIRSD